jgi:GR25 family glycosyltransferase involved in LPS biosynthesis
MKPVIRNPAYVICLERKNKERCDIHFPFIKNLFVNAKRMDAVDASTLDVQSDKRVSLFAKYHLQTTLDTDVLHLSMKGAVGCAMSHINVWKKIADSGEPGFVIEDDINIDGQETDLATAFARLPDDDSIDFASFMYLNWGNTKIRDHANYNDDWYQISSRYFSGTQMYYLTPNGAKLLLENVYPIATHIDVYIAYVAATKSYNFKAIFLKQNLYPFHLEWKDNLQSTLGHDITIKKILPDGNLFYYIVLFLVLFFLISSVVLFIHRHKK